VDKSNGYLALSYVWGCTADNSNEGVSIDENLPSQLPLTIEDAILATIDLGFSYLWIDRYCIDQSKPAEVFAQVSLMNVIYEHAEMTLVAAAGEDPSYELPGISTLRRYQQHRAVIGDRTLVSLPIEPSQLIENSKWNQRGWTYQEAVLSKRRVVFTDSEIYCQCYGITCAESTDVQLDKVQSGDFSQYERRDRHTVHVTFPYGVGSSQPLVLDRISDYSSRQFTNQGDILNGFLGILGSFKEKFDIEDCWGVPIFPKPLYPFSQDKDWNSSKGFLKGMFSVYTHYNIDGIRRQGFPTWSWTKYDHNGSMQDIGFCTLDDDVDFAVELKDGRVPPWDEFHSTVDGLERQALLSPFIHVKVWQFPVRIEPLPTFNQDKKCQIQFQRSIREWDEPCCKDIPLRLPETLTKAQLHEVTAKVISPFVHRQLPCVGNGFVPCMWLVFQTEGGWYERAIMGGSIWHGAWGGPARVNPDKNWTRSFGTIKLG
jgi:Heterokaryon incompatibility protein (HET)